MVRKLVHNFLFRCFLNKITVHGMCLCLWCYRRWTTGRCVKLRLRGVFAVRPFMGQGPALHRCLDDPQALGLDLDPPHAFGAPHCSACVPVNVAKLVDHSPRSATELRFIATIPLEPLYDTAMGAAARIVSRLRKCDRVFSWKTLSALFCGVRLVPCKLAIT